MEISDVIAALEELKNGIAAVKSANENVERAATAARKVCEAFGACASQMEGFPKTVMDPIRGKVAEITDASAEMVRSCAASVEELRNETKNISDTFSSVVGNACERIQSDINEFHREIGAFESKLSRVANRVEEKTDGVVSEVKKIAETMHGDMESFTTSQTQALEALGSKVAKSESSIKDDIVSSSDGLGKSVVQEAQKTRGRVEESCDTILGGITSVKKIVIATAIFAFVAAACAVVVVIKSYCG